MLWRRRENRRVSKNVGFFHEGHRAQRINERELELLLCLLDVFFRSFAAVQVYIILLFLLRVPQTIPVFKCLCSVTILVLVNRRTGRERGVRRAYTNMHQQNSERRFCVSALWESRWNVQNRNEETEGGRILWNIPIKLIRRAKASGWRARNRLSDSDCDR